MDIATYRKKAPKAFFWSKNDPLWALTVIVTAMLAGVFLTAFLHRFFYQLGPVQVPLAFIVFFAGVMLTIRGFRALDELILWLFHKRNNLLGANAPSWTLTEQTKAKKPNWKYVRARLSDRHLEAARVLAVDFTGDLDELIMVAKALD